jgi:hypothetical protein
MVRNCLSALDATRKEKTFIVLECTACNAAVKKALSMFWQVSISMLWYRSKIQFRESI